MESESDLAKELFDKVILPIQAKNIDSKKTYQNIPVKQDNTKQEKTHREALLRLNEKRKREIKEKQKEMKKTQELEKRRQELPASPAIETPASLAIETPAIQALPAPPEIETPTIQTPTLPALPPPAIKVNKEELLSENNIDNLLTILRKTLSQKQDETENITEQDDNALVITQSDDNKLIEPVNNNSEVETVVRTQSSTPAPAPELQPEPAPAPAPAPQPDPAPAPAPASAVVTSCDDEDCQEPINTSQSQQVSPEQDISLTPPDLSKEESITNLTQKIPELNIGDKMSWISQALAALFSTIGTLFTFEPVQDNDPYVNEEKEKQGYVYVGKMYMKPEDESKRPDKVKYISYNPTEKDFYIDEREEVKE